MRNLFIVAGLSYVATLGMLAPSFAACVGAGTREYCGDGAGNTYSIQRFGRQLYINGFNAKTGSTWSQTVTVAAGAISYSGRSNGDSWSMTDQRLGSTHVFSYTDSGGRTWSYTCTPSGCQLNCAQASCK